MKEALPDLSARFRIRHGLFRKEKVEVPVFELDRYGCVIKTDKVFNPGDTLVLDLMMDMPFEPIHAENLTGLITDRRKHCSNFFYLIDFTESDENSRAAEKLSRIREVLSRKLTLRSRRSSSPGTAPASGYRKTA